MQDIKDKYGNVIGYRELDTWDSNKINVFDKYGKKIGYYKKNTWTGDWEYSDL